MDASLFAAAGGVQSLGKFVLADGQEHELFFKGLAQSVVARQLGASMNIEKGENREAMAAAIHQLRAKFVSDSMTDETGEPLMTLDQAKAMPLGLLVELWQTIVAKSSSFTVADAKKD